MIKFTYKIFCLEKGRPNKEPDSWILEDQQKKEQRL